MTLSPDERTLYVVAHEPRALISRVDLDSFQSKWSLALPEEPVELRLGSRRETRGDHDGARGLAGGSGGAELERALLEGDSARRNLLDQVSCWWRPTAPGQLTLFDSRAAVCSLICLSSGRINCALRRTEGSCSSPAKAWTPSSSFTLTMA